MRKFVFVVGIVAALIVGTVLVLPALVPMQTVAAGVKDQVKQATGRDMDFTNAKIMLWPNIGVELKKVTFSNPAWAQEKNMVSLEKADVVLAVTPLLQRRIEVKRFVLDEPVIHLEIGADGKRSWDFSDGKPAPKAAEAATASSASKGFDFQFGQMEVNKGRLTLADKQKGTTTVLDDVNVEVALPDLKSSLEMKGSMVYKQKKIDLAVGLEKPMEFFEGKESPGRATVKTEDFSAKAEGVLATQGTMLKGTVDATVDSLSKLAAWAGDGKEQKMPFNKISFGSAIQLTKTDMVLKNAMLALDEVQAKGNMNIGFSGKPDIFARLSLNKLNLDRFTGGDAAAKDGSAAGQKSAEGWDAAPIDFSGLKAVNADLELKTEGFSLKGADVGPSILTVTLQNGNLHFKSSEASLFEGKFKSDLTLNAAPATPTMAFTFGMTGVQAKPVLTTFADFKKLSGAADANVSVTSAGNNQKAIISALNGNGSVVFKNGSLEGIDLVNIAQMIQKRMTDMGVGAGKTDFVELGGTFTLNKGVASNNDLKMKGPLVQATGKGTISLPQKFVDYRVIPVLTASSAVEGAKGLAVPVDLKGPFSNIKVRPDFAAVVQDVINNPEAAKETLKNIKEQGKSIKENFKDIKKDPARALQMFMGGGAVQQEQPAAEQAPVENIPASQPTP